jgi:hypothetical protein
MILKHFDEIIYRFINYVWCLEMIKNKLLFNNSI